MLVIFFILNSICWPIKVIHIVNIPIIGCIFECSSINNWILYCYFRFSVQHKIREGSVLMSRAIWEVQFRLCFKGSHKIKSLFISIKRKKNFITSWIFQHACWGNLRSVLQKENKSTDILWSNVIIRQKSYIEKMIYSIQSTTIEHVLLFLSSESTRI
jgi:hypothetical protein